MFIMSLKMNHKIRKYIYLFLIIAIVSIISYNWSLNNHKSTNANINTTSSFNGDTNENRIKFFEHFGWETSSEPCEIKDITIPNKFDDVFTKYNELQKEQNMNLSKFKNKIVRHYSYEIYNYPQHPKNIRGNILVYENQIIACDICSLEIDGFMHGVTAKNEKTF